MTVKDLREAIKGKSGNARVYYQRIEDVYFKKHGWDKHSVLKPDHFYGDEAMDEFTRAFTAVHYKDVDNLYITAHH